LNAEENIEKMKSMHYNGDRFVGIDVLDGRIKDVRTIELWEPYYSKKAQFSMAIEAANSLLNIHTSIRPRAKK